MLAYLPQAWYEVIITVSRWMAWPIIGREGVGTVEGSDIGHIVYTGDDTHAVLPPHSCLHFTCEALLWADPYYVQCMLPFSPSQIKNYVCTPPTSLDSLTLLFVFVCLTFTGYSVWVKLLWLNIQEASSHCWGQSSRGESSSKTPNYWYVISEQQADT